MIKPFYSTEAANDLVSILDYAARDKPKAAAKLIDTIEAKCQLITSSPEIGESQPKLGSGVRSSAVGRYAIFYRHVNDRVEILRVIPGDRNIDEL